MRLALLFALVACGRDTTQFNGYRDLVGEVAFSRVLDDGTVICDVDLELTGRPYTSHCNDCEFAFHVDPVVVEDRGTADCVLPSIWTYFDDELATDPGLGWSEASVDFDGNPVDDALMVVGNYEGTRAMAVAMVGDGEPGASVDWDGSSTLSWTVSFDEPAGEPLLLDFCGDFDSGTIDGTRSEGAYKADETLDCAGRIGDVWTFEARAGETVKIVMDTVAADSAFDTVFYVNDPGGCTIASSDDAFVCSFQPLDYRCSGGRFTPEESGTYEIVAYSYDACTADDADGDGFGDRAAYRMSIDADYDPRLTLVEDDAPFTEFIATTSVVGTVEVSR